MNVDPVLTQFIDEALGHKEKAGFLAVYSGSDDIASVAITASDGENPIYMPSHPADYATLIQVIRSKRLLLKVDPTIVDPFFTAHVIKLNGEDFWVSEELVEGQNIWLFLENEIGWINPVAAVVTSDRALSDSLSYADVEGFVIRAYDDDGYILVMLKPQNRS